MGMGTGGLNFSQIPHLECDSLTPGPGPESASAQISSTQVTSFSPPGCSAPVSPQLPGISTHQYVWAPVINTILCLQMMRAPERNPFQMTCWPGFFFNKMIFCLQIPGKVLIFTCQCSQVSCHYCILRSPGSLTTAAWTVFSHFTRVLNQGRPVNQCSANITFIIYATSIFQFGFACLNSLLAIYLLQEVQDYEVFVFG